MTLTKRGVSYSAGGKNYRVTKRADGRIQRTARIAPGLSYVKTSRARRTPIRRTSTGSSGGSGQTIAFILAFVLILAAIAAVAVVLAVMWISCLLSAGVLAIFPNGRNRARATMASGVRATNWILRRKRPQPEPVASPSLQPAKHSVEVA